MKYENIGALAGAIGLACLIGAFADPWFFLPCAACAAVCVWCAKKEQEQERS